MPYSRSLSWQACTRVRLPRRHASTTTPVHSTLARDSTSNTSRACVSSLPIFRSLTAVLGFARRFRTLTSRSHCPGIARQRFARVGSSSQHTGTIFVTHFPTMFLSCPTAAFGFYVITMRRSFTSATATPKQPHRPLPMTRQFRPATRDGSRRRSGAIQVGSLGAVYGRWKI
ncbi:MAG: hypothetical protein JWR69_2552 [Pedosphaera sp.]|nr:hypothetical protein [Pedosphaera sp.]